jgi:hypothetical protein
MREIENNLNNVNFKGIPKPVNEEAVQAPAPVAPAQEKKQIDDLKNMPAESLGKSQVAVSDSIENDMKNFAKHPELAQKLNEVIDEYAENHTEEETLKYMDTAIQEFFAKK